MKNNIHSNMYNRGKRSHAHILKLHNRQFGETFAPHKSLLLWHGAY